MLVRLFLSMDPCNSLIYETERVHEFLTVYFIRSMHKWIVRSNYEVDLRALYIEASVLFEGEGVFRISTIYILCDCFYDLFCGHYLSSHAKGCDCFPATRRTSRLFLLFY